MEPPRQLRFDIEQHMTAPVHVIASGADAVRFCLNGQPNPFPDERLLPDIGELFVEAVNYRLFPSQLDGEVAASLLKREVGDSSIHWRLNVGTPSTQFFSTLINCILSRDLADFAIYNTESKNNLMRLPASQPLLGGRLSIPRWSAIRLDYVEASHPNRDRYLHVQFQSPPRRETKALIFEILDTWAKLLLLGGYPAQGDPPWHSAAIADPAYMLDELTIEKEFPDLFLCSDDAYIPIVESLNWVNQKHERIDSIVLR